MSYETREQVLEAFKRDPAFYAEYCLKIVDKSSQLVPLTPRPAQKKLYAARQAQIDAGLPVRLLVLKSRKVGISTAVQGLILQNCTQNKHRRGLIVAHDGKTSGTLFDIGNRMYLNLPQDPAVKPPLRSRRNTSRDRHLAFGNRPGVAIQTGDPGLDSSIVIDTANEVEAGRGDTVSDLHGSEAAFWRDSKKALSLLNSVPDVPGTEIYLESTANGANWFKGMCDRALRGEGSFVLVFIGWTEDPDCTRPFPTEEAREAFIASIGTGPWGAEEPRLIETFGCTPEQLNWRRHTIVDKCEGKLPLFKQEYPSSPEEAFVGSGKHVFSIEFVSQMLDRANTIDKMAPARVGLGGPQRGLLLPAGVKTRQLTTGTIEVPTGAVWTPAEITGFGPEHAFWTIWRQPWRGADDVRKRWLAGAPGITEADVTAAALRDDPPGQYIVTMDPAGGDENTAGEQAFHAIEVIDHRTGEQVAEYVSRMDIDLVAEQLLLVAMFFNDAWISIEATGGWGLAPLRKLWKDYGYRFVYQRRQLEGARERTQDRLGWSTDRRTKPLMEDTARALLREGNHGIRSRMLGLEFTTYVRLSDGSHGPDAEAFSDLLMAWMQAQQLRMEIPLKPVLGKGNNYSSLTRTFPGGVG